MCKPHKMGWDNRWKRKDKMQYDLDEDDILDGIYNDEEKEADDESE